MKFDDVINDIEKMVGLELESIKKGANITLTGVDGLSKRIELITSKGQKRTRSFSEFEKIWDKLCSSPAAHVDTVLGGSGSSRNQPETIMANLPYIEWFFLDGKKHLTLMNEHTHDYGTIQKMDDITAEGVKDKLINIDNTVCEIVVISEDIRSTANAYEKINGLPLKPVSPGIYEQIKDKVRFVLVSRKSLNEKADPGTYIVVTGSSADGTGRNITINEKEYSIISESGLKYLVSLDE